MIWQGISKVEFWVTKHVRNDLAQSITPCSQFYKSGRKIFIGQCSLKLNNQFCALIPKCRRFDVFSFDFWRQVLRDIVLDGLKLSGLEGFHFLPVCFNSSSDKMSYWASPLYEHQMRPCMWCRLQIKVGREKEGKWMGKTLFLQCWHPCCFRSPVNLDDVNWVRKPRTLA